jgi:hypothetical protein
MINTLLLSRTPIPDQDLKPGVLVISPGQPTMGRSADHIINNLGPMNVFEQEWYNTCVVTRLNPGGTIT